MTEDKLHIVLETKNLKIGYHTKVGETTIASGINITLQKGELVGLIGANGIGKSTLLRTLTKVQQPLSGDININGKSITNYNSIDLAKSLSIVLTEQVASKNLSVAELVALGRQPYTNWVGNLTQEDKTKVNQALELTHIEDLKYKKCYELSDGQLQKAMISRALAQDTDLIILDEPTTHLDMYHKAYILKLLQKLAKETNKTILFSSHEIDLANQLCNKIIIMTKGEVETDSPCNLITKGSFEKLFPKDLIEFDDKTGSFRIKK
ncbi:ABC transporter ATP-binding protein [Mangrovimonas aestuarii]|uniref:ABC transporter ATP-binding protein n=1 Tax=Mangrovimonas aestuarii TaxID=3018443 RepID=UPI0023796FE2|nr:ABC transporter ATP-binding protein [Mangrovimonas aestuarii]